MTEYRHIENWEFVEELTPRGGREDGVLSHHVAVPLLREAPDIPSDPLIADVLLEEALLVAVPPATAAPLLVGQQHPVDSAAPLQNPFTQNPFESITPPANDDFESDTPPSDDEFHRIMSIMDISPDEEEVEDVTPAVDVVRTAHIPVPSHDTPPSVSLAARGEEYEVVFTSADSTLGLRFDDDSVSRSMTARVAAAVAESTDDSTVIRAVLTSAAVHSFCPNMVPARSTRGDVFVRTVSVGGAAHREGVCLGNTLVSVNSTSCLGLTRKQCSTLVQNCRSRSNGGGGSSDAAADDSMLLTMRFRRNPEVDAVRAATTCGKVFARCVTANNPFAAMSFGVGGATWDDCYYSFERKQHASSATDTGRLDQLLLHASEEETQRKTQGVMSRFDLSHPSGERYVVGAIKSKHYRALGTLHYFSLKLHMGNLCLCTVAKFAARHFDDLTPLYARLRSILQLEVLAQSPTAADADDSPTAISQRRAGL